MQNLTLPTTVGIYDTHVSIVCHKNGSTTLTVPYVRWCGQTGHLSTYTVLLTGYNSTLVRDLFNGDGYTANYSLGEFINYRAVPDR